MTELDALRADIAALQTSRRLWRDRVLDLRARLAQFYVVGLPADPLPDHLLAADELEERRRDRRAAELAAERAVEARYEASREWCDEMAELLGNRP